MSGPLLSSSLLSYLSYLSYLSLLSYLSYLISLISLISLSYLVSLISLSLLSLSLILSLYLIGPPTYLGSSPKETRTATASCYSRS